MKKASTLISAIMISLALEAQVFVENFNAGVMPPSGWSVSGQATNWRISQSANAGGSAPEGRLTWTPQFNTLTRLISPPINLTGSTTVILSFKHMVDFYEASFQIGVSTRSGGAAGVWTNVFTRTVTANIPAEDLVVVISNSDVNKPDFQFSIFFSGNSFNLDDWFFDNFSLVVPANLDAGLTDLNVPTYFYQTAQVAGKVTNLGLTPITSYKLNWQANSGAVFTTPYTGLNLQTGISHNFVSNHPVNLPGGVYDLNVWVSEVNGLTADDNPANDSIVQMISVASSSTARRPLFEQFTSSTCPPCATFNSNVMNPFFLQHGHNITLIKYQMNWPGAGDPYYTLEGGTRRTYYGVTGVPSMVIEGNMVSTTAAAVNSAFNTALNNPAFIDINSYHVIDGDHVHIQATINPFINLFGVRTHIVVLEETTFGNVGTNGETSFKHVKMKMVPNANGTTVDVVDGEPLTLSYSQNMAATFVEEMNDLLVTVFVQDHASKVVFQSDYSTEIGAFVGFDPEPGSIEVPRNSPVIITFSNPVRMIGGQAITNENVSTLISYTVSEPTGVDFPFTASINDTKTQIEIWPDSIHQPNTQYFVTVAAVENFTAIATLESSTYFTTGIEVGITATDNRTLRVYPNPVRESFTVELPGKLSSSAMIQIVDMEGRVHFSKQLGSVVQQRSFVNIPVGNLAEGIYIVRLFSDKEQFNTRIVVLK